jgi:tyrosine-protein phosphatase YwqE
MIDLHCHFLPGIDDGAQTISKMRALVWTAKYDYPAGIAAAYRESDR